MLYRELGNTGEKVSILGFGAMRLPIIDGEISLIDEAKAIAMIRHGIDSGINYLDTAYPYHGGKSELLCAKVMQDGYRQKVNIATKLPCWEVSAHSDMDRLLNEQMQKLDVDVIDLYLAHALTKAHWATVKQHDYKTFLDRAKRDGKIRYAGFSFHDSLDLFREIVDDYGWDFCQIQLNYMDENYQAGIEGMRYATEKGMGIIVMEPLRGGMLSKTELPPKVDALWQSAEKSRTPTEWALRYVWDFPEVNVVLSGMSSLDQVTENINIASEALPQSLTAQEKSIIQQVKDFYKERMIVDCTSCQYCMPCPSGVNIPELLWAYNHAAIFNDRAKAKFLVTKWLKEQERASQCIECGTCEEKCPQHIGIMKHLKIIADTYETE